MPRFLVLDFVCNHPGTSSAGLARLVMAQTGVPLSQTTLVARPDQAALRQELLGLGGVETVTTPEARGEKFMQVPTVLRIVQQMLPQLDEGETILVVSYSGPVLSNSKSMGLARVETQSFRNFFSPGTVVEEVSPGHSLPIRPDVSSVAVIKAPAESTGWDFDWLCPIEEALKSMVSALDKAGYNCMQRSVSDTNLRPLMAYTDGRFFGKGQATRTQGMISQLIAAAQARGVVGVARHPRGARFIWLKSGATQNAISRTALVSAIIPQATGPLPDSGIPAIPADQGRGPPPDAGAATAIPQPPPTASMMGGIPSQPAQAVAVEAHATTPPCGGRTAEKFDYRSGRLQTALHEAGFGPYSDGRMKMYAIIEDLVRERPGTTLSHLVREA